MKIIRLRDVENLSKNESARPIKFHLNFERTISFKDHLPTLPLNVRNTVDTRIKEPASFCFMLMRFLYIRCVVRNQPGEALKRFLKLFLEMLYSIY